MQLYNTESKRLEKVTPLDGKELKMYCCGPTVYAAAHVGNFRTFTTQDILRRVLEHTGSQEGWTVKHVRNLTDVDDKTINQALQEKKPLKEVTEFWTAKFHKDAADLGLLSPHIEPKATEYIPHQIELIQRLIDKGFAYAGEDKSIYYDVSKNPNPEGRLTFIAPEEVRKPTASKVQKLTRNAADFVLWKSHKESDGDILWNSPFGNGRPGWHIECSAMSLATLGETIDIHGGGVDLKFPHHENEILQSESASGKCFCKHWAHSEHLLIDNEKMAKSLGNTFTLDGLSKLGWTPTVIHYALLAAHYRKQLDLTHEGLLAAKQTLSQLQRFRKTLPLTTTPKASNLFAPVSDALQNDLNTPEALGQLFQIIQNPELQKANKAEVAAGFDYVTGQLLGLDLSKSIEPPLPEDIRLLAEQRLQAKQAKDFSTSDSLRHKIVAKNYKILDNSTGYTLEHQPIPFDKPAPVLTV